MPKVRTTDPTTSHEAAESVKNMTPLKTAILDCLTIPMNDEHLVSFVQWRYGHDFAAPSGIRSRRKELCVAGLIKDTGDREVLKSGRKAIVWGRS
jgi:hypothetical protein